MTGGLNYVESTLQELINYNGSGLLFFLPTARSVVLSDFPVCIGPTRLYQTRFETTYELTRSPAGMIRLEATLQTREPAAKSGVR